MRALASYIPSRIVPAPTTLPSRCSSPRTAAPETSLWPPTPPTRPAYASPLMLVLPPWSTTPSLGMFWHASSEVGFPGTASNIAP